LAQANPSSPLFVKVTTADLIVFGSDTFARIANTVDLTTLPRDRTVAVQKGLTTYLTSSIVLQFADLVTAQAAYQTIVARLSTLVLQWRTADSTFNTNPYQDYPLPQTDISVESQLETAYNAQVAALKVAQANRDAISAQATACSQTCQANNAIYTIISADVAFLQNAITTINGLHASDSPALVGGTCYVTPTVVTNVLDPVRDYCLNGADPTSIRSFLTKKKADQLTYQSLVRSCQAQCQDLSTQLLQAQSIVNAAQTDVNAALAAVLAVCPTFVPSS
jgi:hypothetical protein